MATLCCFVSVTLWRMHPNEIDVGTVEAPWFQRSYVSVVFKCACVCVVRCAAKIGFCGFEKISPMFVVYIALTTSLYHSLLISAGAVSLFAKSIYFIYPRPPRLISPSTIHLLYQSFYHCSNKEEAEEDEKEDKANESTQSLAIALILCVF